MAGHRKRARKQCGRKRTHGKKPAGKRYAEDAQFRERLLAASRAYYAAHQSKLQARRRERYREEAEQRRNADPSSKRKRNRKRMVHRLRLLTYPLRNLLPTRHIQRNILVLVSYA